MLYVLAGNQKDKAREKSKELILALQKKRPDAELFRMNTENWNPGELESHIGGQGLFSQKYIIVLDSLFEDKEAKEIILQRVKDLQASSNVFVILEGALDAKTKKKFENVAEKSQFFEGEEKEKEEFKIFSMADAFGARDKKRLWVLYRKAKKESLEDEQIFGTLFWQLKSLVLSSEFSNAKEAGLNPFVFGKAKDYSKNYTLLELKTISSELISLYHDSRRGIRDLDNALEKFILSL